MRKEYAKAIRDAIERGDYLEALGIWKITEYSAGEKWSVDDILLGIDVYKTAIEGCLKMIKEEKRAEEKLKIIRDVGIYTEEIGKLSEISKMKVPARNVLDIVNEILEIDERVSEKLTEVNNLVKEIGKYGSMGIETR